MFEQYVFLNFSKDLLNHTRDLKQSSKYHLTHASLPMPSTFPIILTPSIPVNKERQNAVFSIFWKFPACEELSQCRKAVDAPAVAVFNARLAKALSNLV